jgi:HK97 family phage portal protein
MPMGVWSRVAGWLRKSGPDDDQSWDDRLFGDWGGGGPTNSGIEVNSLSALQHVACMACVSILAGDLAKIPLRLCRPGPNGGKQVVTDHWVADLLRHPNDWQTAFEFKELLQASLVLRGNAYAVAVRDYRGRPKYLVPIHPDRVGVFEAPDGSYFYAVTRNGLHEIAMLRDKPLLIPSEDMLHIRWLSTWNSLLGSSRLTMMRESLGLGIGMERHQARFLGQGARTAGVLTTEQKFASKERRDELRSEFQRLQGGWRNSGATAVLEQGLQWKPLGLTMVDAEFIESRKFQLRDIARAFDVPPYRLAIEGDAQGPAMVQAEQQYLNGPISGYCERWKAKGEQFFELDGEQLYLDWDYSHFLKADIVSRYTAYRQSVGTPWMRADEARAAEGLDKVEGGDKVYFPVNMAPAGKVPPGASDSQPGSDQTGSPAPGGDGDALRDPADDPAPGV